MSNKVWRNACLGYLTFTTTPNTLNERKPSMRWAYSIWQPFSTSRHFLAPNSVYVKLFFNSHDTQRCYHQHGHRYVGSTAIGIPGREHNRRAKLKQLAKNTPISAKLSLRYWHSTNTITQFSTIHIATYPDYDQAWIYEHLNISRWQPTLNWPYISQHLKLKAG